MDATCNFQEEKKGREKPQVMHIRLRICHIFLAWSMSKPVYNLAPLCVCVYACVCVRLRMSESAFTHPSMSSCVELRGAVKLSPSPDMTRLFSAVWTFAAPLGRVALHCVSQRAAAVTWPVTLHTYRFSPLHAQGHTGVTVLRGGIM